jgi:hypothetical protein
MMEMDCYNWSKWCYGICYLKQKFEELLANRKGIYPFRKSKGGIVMSQYMKDILNYGEDVNDFEVSPFESVHMLHDRSELHRVYHELTLEEQQLLSEYDL